MKKSLLLLFFSLSFTQIIAQSSVILPNGNVIPSFTLANRPATNQTVGQLIYQTDGTSGLYVWSGTAWTAVAAGSGGSGTVTNVTASAPISVINGTTTPTLSISQANSTTNGFLSTADWNSFNNKQNALSNANATTNGILTSADWNTFSNKGSFNLPSLTDGSVLFSDGTTISQNNSSLKWNNSLRRLDIKGLNDGTIGAGFTNWISTSIGGSGGNRIVAGVQNGEATIGAHNETLSGWSKLVINPAGPTAVGSLVGVGNRMVVANAEGELSTQAIPTGNIGTVTNVVGTSPISVTNGLSTPTIAISQANSATNGFLSSIDWTIFNNKQNALPNASTSTSGILTNTDWNTFNNKQNTLPNANSSTSGVLTSTDWTIFNNKQNALSNANGSTSGILTNTDWTTFNNKQNALSNANGSTSGILTSADWTTFNNKFSLPALTNGSVLFSNGTNITQNNAKLFWDNTNFRLGIGVSTPAEMLEVNGTAKVNALGAYVPSVNAQASLDVGIDGSVYNGTFGGNLNALGTPISTFGSIAQNNAFDGVDNGISYWVAAAESVGYIGKDFATQKTIRRYRFKIYNIDGNYPQAIYCTWTFQGSNDGSTWSDLHYVNNYFFYYAITNPAPSYSPYYTLSNVNSYRYYRLNFTGFSKDALINGTPIKPSIFELEMYEENQSTVPQSGGLMVKKNGTVGIGLVPAGNNRLEISGTAGLKVSSTNVGSGTSDWIASNVGGTAGDRVVSGNLNGKATIGAHNSDLNTWSNLAINNGGGIVTIGGDATTPASLANGGHGRPLSVNGSIRQGFYIVPVNVPANGVSYVTWTHSLGYGPIVMMSTDQNGGGNNMDYVTVTTFNNDPNQTVFILRNSSGVAANGALRWILVW